MSLVRQRRILLGSVLLLAFVGGASVGVTSYHLVSARTGSGIRVKYDNGSALLDRLNLTGAQRQRAESVLARRSPRARAVLEATAQELREIADSVDSELRALLTPEQQQRLDEARREGRTLLKLRVPTPQGERIDTILDSERPPR